MLPNGTTGKGIIVLSATREYDGEWIIKDGKKVRHGRGIYTMGTKKFSGVWKFDATESIEEISANIERSDPSAQRPLPVANNVAQKSTQAMDSKDDTDSDDDKEKEKQKPTNKVASLPQVQTPPRKGSAAFVSNGASASNKPAVELSPSRKLFAAAASLFGGSSNTDQTSTRHEPPLPTALHMDTNKAIPSSIPAATRSRNTPFGSPPPIIPAAPPAPLDLSPPSLPQANGLFKLVVDDFRSNEADQLVDENQKSEGGVDEVIADDRKPPPIPMGATTFVDTAGEKFILCCGCLFYLNGANYEGEYIVVDGKYKFRHGRGTLYNGKKVQQHGVWDFGLFVDQVLDEESSVERTARRSYARNSLVDPHLNTASPVTADEYWKGYIVQPLHPDALFEYIKQSSATYHPIRPLVVRVLDVEQRINNYIIEISFDDVVYSVKRNLDDVKSLASMFLPKHFKIGNTALEYFSSPKTSGQMRDPGVISQLNKALHFIVSDSELVLSRVFMSFVDPEILSVKSQMDPLLLEPECVHSILFRRYEQECVYNEVVVWKSFTQSCDLEPGDYLLWAFFTSKYDIGFSVEMDGVVTIPYLRYKSVVYGVVKANSTVCRCILKWDNSYSKMRSKTLSWKRLIISSREFEEAAASKYLIDGRRKHLIIAAYSMSTWKSGTALNPKPDIDVEVANTTGSPNATVSTTTAAPSSPIETVLTGTIEISSSRRYEGQYIVVNGKKLRHGSGLYFIGKKVFRGVWSRDATVSMEEASEDSKAIAVAALARASPGAQPASPPASGPAPMEASVIDVKDINLSGQEIEDSTAARLQHVGSPFDQSMRSEDSDADVANDPFVDVGSYRIGGSPDVEQSVSRSQLTSQYTNILLEVASPSSGSPGSNLVSIQRNRSPPTGQSIKNGGSTRLGGSTNILQSIRSVSGGAHGSVAEALMDAAVGTDVDVYGSSSPTTGESIKDDSAHILHSVQSEVSGGSQRSVAEALMDAAAGNNLPVVSTTRHSWGSVRRAAETTSRVTSQPSAPALENRDISEDQERQVRVELASIVTNPFELEDTLELSRNDSAQISSVLSQLIVPGVNKPPTAVELPMPSQISTFRPYQHSPGETLPDGYTGKGIIKLGQHKVYEGEWIVFKGSKVRHGAGLYTVRDQRFKGTWRYDVVESIQLLTNAIDKSTTKEMTADVRVMDDDIDSDDDGNDEEQVDTSGQQTPVLQPLSSSKLQKADDIIFYSNDLYFEGKWIVVNNEKLRHGDGIITIGTAQYGGMWDYGTLLVGDMANENAVNRDRRANLANGAANNMVYEAASAVASSSEGLKGKGKIVYSSDAYYEGEWLTLKGEKMRHGLGTLFVGSNGPMSGNWDFGTLVYNPHDISGREERRATILRVAEKCNKLNKGSTVHKYNDSYHSEVSANKESKLLPSPSSPDRSGGNDDRYDDAEHDAQIIRSSFAGRFTSDTLANTGYEGLSAKDAIAQEHISSRSGRFDECSQQTLQELLGVSDEESPELELAGNGLLFYSKAEPGKDLEYYEGEWISVNGEKLRHGHGTLYQGKSKLEGEWDYGTFVNEKLKEESFSERETRRFNSRSTVAGLRESERVSSYIVQKSKYQEVNHQKGVQSSKRQLEISVALMFPCFKSTKQHNQLFDVEVIAGTMRYTITRSVEDLVVFGSRLQKKYPHKRIRLFPAQELKLAPNSMQNTPDTPNKLLERYAEFNRQLVHDYLIQECMTDPKIVSSQLFRFFLDSEVTSMQMDAILLEPNVHNLLLTNVPVYTKKVRTQYHQNIKDIKAGEIVLYSFRTSRNPIDFGVTVDRGVTQVPLIRHQSQKGAIMGAMEATSDIKLTKLKWVNCLVPFGFSILTPPETLYYSVCVASKDEYQEALRRKLMYGKCRSALMIAARNKCVYLQGSDKLPNSSTITSSYDISEPHPGDPAVQGSTKVRLSLSDRLSAAKLSDAKEEAQSSAIYQAGTIITAHTTASERERLSTDELYRREVLGGNFNNPTEPGSSIKASYGIRFSQQRESHPSPSNDQSEIAANESRPSENKVSRSFRSVAFDEESNRVHYFNQANATTAEGIATRSSSYVEDALLTAYRSSSAAVDISTPPRDLTESPVQFGENYSVSMPGASRVGVHADAALDAENPTQLSIGPSSPRPTSPMPPSPRLPSPKTTPPAITRTMDRVVSPEVALLEAFHSSPETVAELLDPEDDLVERLSRHSEGSSGLPQTQSWRSGIISLRSRSNISIPAASELSSAATPLAPTVNDNLTDGSVSGSITQSSITQSSISALETWRDRFTSFRTSKSASQRMESLNSDASVSYSLEIPAESEQQPSQQSMSASNSSVVSSRNPRKSFREFSSSIRATLQQQNLDSEHPEDFKRDQMGDHPTEQLSSSLRQNPLSTVQGIWSGEFSIPTERSHKSLLHDSSHSHNSGNSSDGQEMDDQRALALLEGFVDGLENFITAEDGKSRFMSIRSKSDRGRSALAPNAVKEREQMEIERRSSVTGASGNIYLSDLEVNVISSSCSKQDVAGVIGAYTFDIEIKVENIAYKIKRSFDDFVFIDKILKRRYPRSSALVKFSLPSPDATIQSDVGSIQVRQTRGPKSLLSSPSVVTGGVLNNMKAVEKLLEDYLSSLLQDPGVIIDDDFLVFIDPEAPSAMVDDIILEPTCVHSLLLSTNVHNFSWNETDVKPGKTSPQVFQLKPGQFLLWIFRTTSFDLGLSVEVDGSPKMPFARFKSHLFDVLGEFQAGEKTCIVTLTFDNTYSKVRSKHLYWAVRIVDDNDYMDALKEKHDYDDKRYTVRSFLYHRSVGKDNGAALQLYKERALLPREKPRRGTVIAPVSLGSKSITKADIANYDHAKYGRRSNYTVVPTASKPSSSLAGAENQSFTPSNYPVISTLDQIKKWITSTELIEGSQDKPFLLSQELLLQIREHWEALDGDIDDLILAVKQLSSSSNLLIGENRHLMAKLAEVAKELVSDQSKETMLNEATLRQVEIDQAYLTNTKLSVEVSTLKSKLDLTKMAYETKCEELDTLLAEQSRTTPLEQVDMGRLLILERELELATNEKELLHKLLQESRDQNDQHLRQYEGAFENLNTQALQAMQSTQELQQRFRDTNNGLDTLRQENMSLKLQVESLKSEKAALLDTHQQATAKLDERYMDIVRTLSAEKQLLRMKVKTLQKGGEASAESKKLVAMVDKCKAELKKVQSEANRETVPKSVLLQIELQHQERLQSELKKQEELQVHMQEVIRHLNSVDYNQMQPRLSSSSIKDQQSALQAAISVVEQSLKKLNESHTSGFVFNEASGPSSGYDDLKSNAITELRLENQELQSKLLAMEKQMSKEIDALNSELTAAQDECEEAVLRLKSAEDDYALAAVQHKASISQLHFALENALARPTGAGTYVSEISDAMIASNNELRRTNSALLINLQRTDDDKWQLLDVFEESLERLELASKESIKAATEARELMERQVADLQNQLDEAHSQILMLEKSKTQLREDNDKLAIDFEKNMEKARINQRLLEKAALAGNVDGVIRRYEEQIKQLTNQRDLIEVHLREQSQALVDDVRKQLQAKEEECIRLKATSQQLQERLSSLANERALQIHDFQLLLARQDRSARDALRNETATHVLLANELSNLMHDCDRLTQQVTELLLVDNGGQLPENTSARDEVAELSRKLRVAQLTIQQFDKDRRTEAASKETSAGTVKTLVIRNEKLERRVSEAEEELGRMYDELEKYQTRFASEVRAAEAKMRRQYDTQLKVILSTRQEEEKKRVEEYDKSAADLQARCDALEKRRAEIESKIRAKADKEWQIVIDSKDELIEKMRLDLELVSANGAMEHMRNLEAQLAEVNERLKKSERLRREFEEKFREQRIINDSQLALSQQAQSLQDQLNVATARLADLEKIKRSLEEDLRIWRKI